MTTDENTTPEPVETTSSRAKRDYLDQVIAEDEAYGFVVPAGEEDD